jgi:hypothetical protein
VDYDDAAELLECIGVLRSRCDLGLLILFAQHPTALLTSERLASLPGHELKAIATSLDVVLDARIRRASGNAAPASAWAPRH